MVRISAPTRSCNRTNDFLAQAPEVRVEEVRGGIARSEIDRGKHACVDWFGHLPLCPQSVTLGLVATKQITGPNVP